MNKFGLHEHEFFIFDSFMKSKSQSRVLQIFLLTISIEMFKELAQLFENISLLIKFCERASFASKNLP